jgi:transposase, IS5 family
MARQPGLFDIDERLRRLSDIGDQLEAFAAVVDFEMFRPELNASTNPVFRLAWGRPEQPSSREPAGWDAAGW